MDNKIIFNMTVCIMGILIITIHIVNLLVKKKKRTDEKALLDFFLFTVVHFATYLTFTFIKTAYTSNAFIIAFYTVFYIMNNVEVFMLFRYMKTYVVFPKSKERTISVINACLFAVFVILDIINIFTGIFFTAENGVYLRSKTMIFSQGYQFFTFILIIFLTATNKQLNFREKSAFTLYCLLPFVAIILQNAFRGYAIAYASIIIATEVLFLFLSVQKNIIIAMEEEKNKNAQVKIMISQIKPHFIYNSLSSISTLILIDPERAQTALDDFTEYLRHNLSTLTESKLISFEEELKHVKTYVSLEKVRFGDRVNVVYNVKSTDFYLPPLSIQPIVENAIKHGVLKKVEGGTVTVSSFETDGEYVVTIKDDGVGFDTSKVDRDNNEHIGLKNIDFRISKVGNGRMTVSSQPGKGTTVTVMFAK